MTDTAAPSISILLPTYNGEHYLAEQLDSILGQTWTDFELLVLDDGSSDNTPALVESYSRRDPRIIHLPAEGNRGQKARLVELVEAARSPLIAISDQDDVWEPNKLERLTASLGNAALAFGRSELIDGEGHRLNAALLEALQSPYRSGDRLSLFFAPQVSGHAMLARREMFYKEAFASSEPFDWLISLVAAFSRGIVYRDDAIVFHRLHGANFHNTEVIVRLREQRHRTPFAKRVRRGIGKLRPLRRIKRIRRFLERLESERRRVLERLEHVAASALVAEPDRAAFRRAADLGRSAWTERHSPMRRYKLNAELLATLKPFAGSDLDWRVAVDHLTALTFGVPPRYARRFRRMLLIRPAVK